MAMRTCHLSSPSFRDHTNRRIQSSFPPILGDRASDREERENQWIYFSLGLSRTDALVQHQRFTWRERLASASPRKTLGDFDTTLLWCMGLNSGTYLVSSSPK